MSNALAGVVAFVPNTRHPAHAGLVARLRSLGADVPQRLTKDVTHIVYQGTDGKPRIEQDAELRAMHDKASKVSANSQDHAVK